jgi:eukaryotic-like serine/threonine-protein kinase
LIHGLANGVCRLHKNTGVSHGDIQPANLILTSRTSRLMLIDFGSAWTVQTSALRTEGDGHHMNYAAPEVWNLKQPAGWHSDQFSVSVILYHLLTGEIPYPGLGRQSDYPNAIDEMQRALKPPSDLSQPCAALPRSLRLQLDDLVCRGLALTPEGRFQDRHKWLNEFFELHAKLRLTPQLPPIPNFLTRVIERIVGIWDIRR